MNLDELTQQIERDATDRTTPIGQINYAISLSDFLEKVLKKQPHFLKCGQNERCFIYVDQDYPIPH